MTIIVKYYISHIINRKANIIFFKIIYISPKLSLSHTHRERGEEAKLFNSGNSLSDCHNYIRTKIENIYEKSL